MNGGLIASRPSSLVLSPRIPSKFSVKRGTVFKSWTSSINPDHSSPFWDFKSTSNGSENLYRISFRCNSSSKPGGPSAQGENESKTILDAFFLGKALAESINERVESAVGEFLSAIGRLQADQQKQVQDFQEEVLERARRGKEKAAREALEAQGFVPKSSASNAAQAQSEGSSGIQATHGILTQPEGSSGIQATHGILTQSEESDATDGVAAQ